MDYFEEKKGLRSSLTRKSHQKVLPASRPARWQRTRRFVCLVFNVILSSYRKVFKYGTNKIRGILSAGV